eukprot:15466832-Alexandrium_andersonii.AAC.1
MPASSAPRRACRCRVIYRQRVVGRRAPCGKNGALGADCCACCVLVLVLLLLTGVVALAVARAVALVVVASVVASVALAPP